MNRPLAYRNGRMVMKLLKFEGVIFNIPKDILMTV